MAGLQLSVAQAAAGAAAARHQAMGLFHKHKHKFCCWALVRAVAAWPMQYTVLLLVARASASSSMHDTYMISYGWDKVEPLCWSSATGHSDHLGPARGQLHLDPLLSSTLAVGVLA